MYNTKKRSQAGPISPAELRESRRQQQQLSRTASSADYSLFSLPKTSSSVKRPRERFNRSSLDSQPAGNSSFPSSSLHRRIPEGLPKTFGHTVNILLDKKWLFFQIPNTRKVKSSSKRLLQTTKSLELSQSMNTEDEKQDKEKALFIVRRKFHSSWGKPVQRRRVSDGQVFNPFRSSCFLFWKLSPNLLWRQKMHQQDSVDLLLIRTLSTLHMHQQIPDGVSLKQKGFKLYSRDRMDLFHLLLEKKNENESSWEMTWSWKE